MIIYYLCSGRFILIFHSYLLAAPAAMEHEKAPGRPQALLKKDSESDKKTVLWGIRVEFPSGLSFRAGGTLAL